MKREVTKKETDELFRFCRQHYVTQYDVQVELVDHLASSIEEQWEYDPTLSFGKALHNTFGKFGIFGFSKIKEQKEKELRRKYNRLLWNYLLDFYRWPKIMMTFAFTFGLFTLFRLTNEVGWILFSYFMLLSLAIIYYRYKIFPKYYKIETQPGKSFLLLQRLKEIQYAGLMVIQFPLQSYNINRMINLSFVDTGIGLFAVSFLTVSFTISIYGNYFFLPTKIKEHFMAQYAEFAT
jgi:hypothetical protein